MGVLFWFMLAADTLEVHCNLSLANKILPPSSLFSHRCFFLLHVGTYIFLSLHIIFTVRVTEGDMCVGRGISKQACFIWLQIPSKVTNEKLSLLTYYCSLSIVDWIILKINARCYPRLIQPCRITVYHETYLSCHSKMVKSFLLRTSETYHW